MPDHKLYNGLILGIFFTVLSICMIATVMGAALSVVPGLVFDYIAKLLANSGLYDGNVRMLATILLTVTFLFVFLLLLHAIKKRVISTGKFSRLRIFAFLSIIYLLVHPLSFYLYVWIKLDFKLRDEVFDHIFKSFFFSSLAFILIGMLFDVVINRYAKPFKYNEIL